MEDLNSLDIERGFGLFTLMGDIVQTTDSDVLRKGGPILNKAKVIVRNYWNSLNIVLEEVF